MYNTNLTTREQGIYELLLKGFNKKQISKIIYLAPSTINYHMDNIYIKKGVNSQTQLLAQRIEELEKEIEEIKKQKALSAKYVMLAKLRGCNNAN